MASPALIRSWPTLAAWGGGLLQIGIGAGAITQGADAAMRGVGVLLVALGAASLAWGVVALLRSRVAAPRLGMAIALGSIVTAAAALILDPIRISAFAVGVAVLLSIVFGVASAATVRRISRATPEGARALRQARPAGIGGLIVGCVIVAGLVTPALGATTVGQSAPSHSDHELILPGHNGH
ncbi:MULTISPECIES: hypothetical protein [unclassified Microbacterium]|uniref:hypothetical protein n=1 Tax=unclassified Microbacterium TaxID=2609290 RepID=UPI00386FCF52